MSTIEIVSLPVEPSPEIMSLLIKAYHLLTHANNHAMSKNDFDIMVSIHSYDNAVEYILKIIVKHLEIEEKLCTTIDTPGLMELFGEVNGYLKKYALYNTNTVVLPYKNEIRQLHELRNIVQHGMILPISEIKEISKYANRFFEKVLQKIFGLTLNQISYSTLIDNPQIRKYIVGAENLIDEGKYLESIVLSRGAFELGRFLYQASYYMRSPALASLKFNLTDLYHYLSCIDDDIFVLSSKINMDDYRKFVLYIEHIPSEYNANKTGYRVLQREWEKQDAVFCCNFVSSVILSWQLDEIHPLYEIDASGFPYIKNEKSINNTLIPDLYPDKSCLYLQAPLWGELFYVGKNEKEIFEKLRPKDIIKYANRSSLDGNTWRKYTDYRVIHSIDIRVILNKELLWEVILFCEIIPFTEIEDGVTCIDIDKTRVDSAMDNSPNKRTIISFLDDNGEIDDVIKAFKLSELIENKPEDYRLISSILINKLSQSINCY